MSNYLIQTTIIWDQYKKTRFMPLLMTVDTAPN